MESFFRWGFERVFSIFDGALLLHNPLEPYQPETPNITDEGWSFFVSLLAVGSFLIAIEPFCLQVCLGVSWLTAVPFEKALPGTEERGWKRSRANPKIFKNKTWWKKSEDFAGIDKAGIGTFTGFTGSSGPLKRKKKEGKWERQRKDEWAGRGSESTGRTNY